MIGFIAVLLLGTVNGAQARELVAALANEDYPPFYFFDHQEQEIRGASVDICRHVAHSLGYTLTFKRYPFVRLLHSVSEGHADIACTLFNTSARAPGITFTGVPHVFETIAVFTRQSADWSEHNLNLEQLKKFPVGGVRAYFYGKAFEGDTHFDKLEVNDERQLIKVLLAGRVDFALGNPASIRHHATEMGVNEQIVFVPGAVYQGPIYIGISRTRDDAHELASLFTQAVLTFRQSDAYSQLLERYNLSAPNF